MTLCDDPLMFGLGTLMWAVIVFLWGCAVGWNAGVRVMKDVHAVPEGEPE